MLKMYTSDGEAGKIIRGIKKIIRLITLLNNCLNGYNVEVKNSKTY